MPPPSRTHNDPFTDAPLRPTTSNPTSTRSNNPSQQSLRSNASTASSRTRPNQHPPNQASLFAPALSRRPTSRTRAVADGGGGILADEESENDDAPASVPQRRARRGLARHGSPEGKSSGKARLGEGEAKELEFVNRRADGGYLLGVPGVGEMVAVPMVQVPRTEEEVEQDEVDAHYNAISHQHFASGAALGGRSSKKHEEELEQLRLPMMLRLREQVTERLEGERWQYESVEPFRTMM